MQAWWAEETLKNIKNLTVQNLLTGSVYIYMYIYIYIYMYVCVCIYMYIYIYIYIYAFSRRFYPKRLTLHSSYSFTFFLSALAFPGNRTHNLGVASTMLYHLSYRKAHIYVCICIYMCVYMCVYIYVCIYICMYIYMYVCVYICHESWPWTLLHTPPEVTLPPLGLSLSYRSLIDYISHHSLHPHSCSR